jgi:hypothetical protein
VCVLTKGSTLKIGVGTPIFSSDSKRAAYAAHSGDKWFVVVDGKTGKKYDGLNYLTFSPENSRFAYRAQVGSKQVVVEDGQEGKQYDEIGEITFSPDGRHVAYEANMDRKAYLIVDGKELEQYDRIITKIFFDSQEYIHFLAVKHISASEDDVLLVSKKIE